MWQKLGSGSAPGLWANWPIGPGVSSVRAVWNVTIPNFPGASFYNQAIVFDAAANPLGITTSNGGHGVIGF
jgi:hypothetical protein